MRSRSSIPQRCGAAALVVVAEQQPALDLPADAAQRRRGQHAFGRAARCPCRCRSPVSGSVVAMTPATSPSGISLMPQPSARSSAMIAAWRGRSSTQAMISFGSTPLAAASARTLSVDRLVEVDRAFGIARADRDLVHVDVGRVEQAALLGDGQHRERIGPGLGGDGRAFERVERDVDRRAVALGASRPFRRCRASALRRARLRR